MLTSEDIPMAGVQNRKTIDECTRLLDSAGIPPGALHERVSFVLHQLIVTQDKASEVMNEAAKAIEDETGLSATVVKQDD